MGGGRGPTLKASLSREQGYLVATTATTATQSVAFFGLGSPANDTIDTFDGNNELTRLSREYQGNVRTIILSGYGKTAATSITCGTDSYVMFGGGFYSDGTTKDSNDVDIFKCNDDGVFYYDLQQLSGLGRANLAATNMTCGNNSYALFGGGINIGFNTSNDVDIFKCTDDGVFYNDTLQFNGPRRVNLAATTLTCGNDSYALFGGGYVSGLNYSNDVDIFKCNDGSVFYNDTLEFNGPGREQLAATSVTCGNDSYALFGGGFYFDGSSNYSNDVDIFKCTDDGVFYNDTLQFNGPARSGLAATSVTCGNNSYTLFGGGFSGSGNYSNDVDIFKCNDTGVFYHKTIQFNGPGRSNLAATTIRVDGKEYALFAGGMELPTNYRTIDIYDCETEQFLPL